MKIKIERCCEMGTCGCTDITYYDIIEVTPKELVEIIDGCNNISVCNL